MAVEPITLNLDSIPRQLAVRSHSHPEEEHNLCHLLEALSDHPCLAR